MRKLSFIVFFFIVFLFFSANQVLAQQCISGYSCTNVADTAACDNVKGSFGSCTSSLGSGNCCAPWRDCMSGYSCLNASESDCQSSGGSYVACYTGSEPGTCCSPQNDCINPYKCSSLLRDTCEQSGGFYGSCYTGTGAGNCCLPEQYCAFPQICRELTPYECTDVWAGSIGPCSTPLVPNGNCCTYPLVPQKWSCVPGQGCVRAWIGHASSSSCNNFCVGGTMPILCGDRQIDTAIGCISVGSNIDFAQDIIVVGIGIAGGIAFLLMVYAGFLVMTSGGDPKRLAAGKELLTAAIAGLLFLILGTYLLRVIGVDILGIF